MFRQRAMQVLGAVVIGAMHLWLYVTLFGYAFTAGAAGRDNTVLGIAVNILGTPLVHLLYFRPVAPGWGYDSYVLLGLATLNSLLWGAAVIWVALRFSGRPHHAA